MKTNGCAYSFAILSLCLAIVSCQPSRRSAGFIDPVFAYAVPSAIKLFSSTVRDITVLPEEGASAALYAAIEQKSPRIVLLSPLLFTEIEAILSTDDSMKIATFGENPHPANPRLYQASFSSIDASRIAGAAAASQSRKQQPGAKVAGVFSGASQETLQAAATAFSESFLAAGGIDAPFLELSQDDFSQSTAQKMASMDIQIAYISVPPDVLGRWIREAFDPYAYIMAEFPFPEEHHQSIASALIVWDIASTLRLLLSSMESGNNEPIAGRWKIQRLETRKKEE